VIPAKPEDDPGAFRTYIGDQGRVFSSVDEPRPEDLDFAAVGMLTIVRLGELCYYGRE
jgi:hypothetical protein